MAIGSYTELRTFRRICSLIDLLLLTGCIAALALSWRNGTLTMWGFPIVFVLTGLSNIFRGLLKFRKDENRRRHILPGMFLMLIGLLLMGIGVCSAVYIWGS